MIGSAARCEVILNIKIVKVLGLKIPAELIFSAAEVIE